MAEPIPASDVLLTREAVFRRLAEREGLRRVEEDARERGAEIDRWLHGVALVMGDEAWASHFRAPQPDLPADAPESTAAQTETPHAPRSAKARRIAWFSATIDAEQRPLTHVELFDLAKASPMGDGLENSQKELRRLIEQGARRGRLRKRGPFIYSPSVMRLVEKGILEDRAAAALRGNMRDAVSRALKDLGGQAVAGAIRQQLRKYPEIVPKLEHNPQYAYTVMSRMVLEGDLRRVGNLYRFPLGQ